MRLIGILWLKKRETGSVKNIVITAYMDAFSTKDIGITACFKYIIV